MTPAACTVIGAGENLNGSDFGNISKNTAGLNAAYTIPLRANREELVVSGSVYTRSNRIGNITEGTNSAVPGYTLLNGRFDYNNIGGTNFSTGVWVHNIGNKLYVTYRNNVESLSGYDALAYGTRGPMASMSDFASD